MVAQDTGSAIVGPARGDIYFGAGAEAGRIAGRLQPQCALCDADAARARSASGPARPCRCLLERPSAEIAKLSPPPRSAEKPGRTAGKEVSEARRRTRRPPPRSRTTKTPAPTRRLRTRFRLPASEPRSEAARPETAGARGEIAIRRRRWCRRPLSDEERYRCGTASARVGKAVAQDRAQDPHSRRR